MSLNELASYHPDLLMPFLMHVFPGNSSFFLLGLERLANMGCWAMPW
jgi:hypothetical protein